MRRREFVARAASVAAGGLSAVSFAMLWPRGVSAQTPPPTGPIVPTDKSLSGVFTPARVEADQEAAAKKAQDSGMAPFDRARVYYFMWDSMSPAEFEALARHTLFLIAVWTQKPEELPVKRVYIRTPDGQELAVPKALSWQVPVDAGSLTAKMYGPNREDGFYLVPGGALLRQGQIVLDLANRGGWVMMGLPSNVASGDAQHFPDVDPVANGKPDLGQLQAVIARKFPGFPWPQSLP